jgi:hypothetical protein
MRWTSRRNYRQVQRQELKWFRSQCERGNMYQCKAQRDDPQSVLSHVHHKQSRHAVS